MFLALIAYPMPQLLSSLLLLCLLASACRPMVTPAPVNPGVSTLPRLASDQAIGMIESFNLSNPAQTQDSVAARWREALGAGLRIARLQIDWPELEPEEDRYDEAVLREPLEALAQQGQEVFLLISVYDSDGPVLPEYLAGEALDSERLQRRFEALMDWVVPMLSQHGGYALAISNEPDNAFGERRRLARRVQTFARRSRAYIHQLDDSLAVTITLNHGNLAAHERDMRALMAELDIGCFNLYGSGLFPMDQPYSPEETHAHVDQLLDLAGERHVIIQELGMHDATELNSSEEIQQRFFETFFARMQNETQIRAAYVFQLVDWSPETVDLLNQLYEPNTPQDFIDDYGTVLQHLGLIRYEDGQRKAAWDTFVRWVAAI